MSRRRLAYLDCASGASGDMILGALVDAGLPLASLESELAKLGLPGYHLVASQVDRSGIMATKVDVVLEDGAAGTPHRGLAEIVKLLEGSRLEPSVRQRVAGLFRRLAEAEAGVHGTRPEEVHFHEVGAVDAIVDIVGGVWGLENLGVDRFVSSPLNLGTGTIRMSHGTYPVPAPATARLVEGVPVYGEGEGELLTPTGALLVTAHASAYGPLPSMRLQSAGYGAGTRDTPGRPNVLRILVGEEELSTSVEHAPDRVWVLEAEVDDMSPQLFGPLLDHLLTAGALDAYGTPIHMKKGRPGLLLTVLCRATEREPLEEVLFAETTTLGVRRQECERTVLEREVVPVETCYGTIRMKLGRRGHTVYNAQPEFEDCKRAARARGIPIKEVWAEAMATYRTRGTEVS